MLDPHVTVGPVLYFDEAASLDALRGCDSPPDNAVAAGEALLAPRRTAPGSGYARASPNLVLGARPPGASFDAAARAIRSRYEQEVLAKLPVWPVLEVDTAPFTLDYAPGFTGLADPVRVHGRHLRIRASRPARTMREITEDVREINAYYLNYDRNNPVSPSAIFVAAGALGEGDGPSRLRPAGSVGGAMAGHLAARGWPVIVHDDAAETLEESLIGIRMLDGAILSPLRRVDAVGTSDRILHLLVFHQSGIQSAYVAGTFIPLWTRSDTAATGGPFGSDPATQHETIQSRFQWADFALVAISQKIRLGLGINAGGSGLGKAGLLNELVPTLRRFPETSGFYQVRGNDRDGDGVGDNGERCHDGEFADYLDFLKEPRLKWLSFPNRW